MALRPWIDDLFGCAFVATLAAALCVVGACLLAHPLLTSLLVSTSSWYLYHRHQLRTPD